jgi:hypothetical protein
MEINSNAPIKSCHEITINAPLETVWRVHTQINGGPIGILTLRRPTLPDRLRSGPYFIGKPPEWQFLRPLAK